MSFTRPSSLDDFAFVMCCSWATQIRRAMLSGAGFPGHAPANYDAFHDANPQAISAERGNAAIDAEMARVQRLAELERQAIEDGRAEAARQREADKLAIPVAALKIILDHDTSVQRLHTSQIQTAVMARRDAPPLAPPRFWFNKRSRGARGRGGRPPPRRNWHHSNKENFGPSTCAGFHQMHGDVPMRESTPYSAASPPGPSAFGRDLSNFMFGAFTTAEGSSAFPTHPREPEAAVSAPNAPQYPEEFADFDMVDADGAPSATESVTEGLAGMELEGDTGDDTVTED